MAPAHTPVDNSFLKTYIQDSQLYPLFDIMSDQARMRCFTKMQCLTAEAGDMVEDLHTISHSIYIIERGTVHLLTDEGAVMLSVTNGDVFGEMELVTEVRKVLSEFASATMSPLNAISATPGNDVNSGPERQTAFLAATAVRIWQLKIHDFCAAVGEDLMRNQESLRYLFKTAEERRKLMTRCLCVCVCVCRRQRRDKPMTRYTYMCVCVRERERESNLYVYMDVQRTTAKRRTAANRQPRRGFGVVLR